MNNQLRPGNWAPAWWRRFRTYADNCVTSGFLPSTNRTLQRFGKMFTRLWAFIQVGPIQVVGRENLYSEGHLIYCPNHSSMLDAIVMYSLLPSGMRYMTAYEEMVGFWGLRAIIMGAMGSFPVDRGRGRTAIPPAIHALVTGGRLTLFPEGKISNSGEYLPFKKGAAWIAIGASHELPEGTRVGIVPIHLCFGNRDVASAGGSYLKMGFRWRKGIIVSVGKPIYLDEVRDLTPDSVIGRVKDDITSHTCSTTSLPR